ncbi:hypothetical protein LINPERPRIM_LOCUS20066, partial [Linum perenne]
QRIIILDSFLSVVCSVGGSPSVCCKLRWCSSLSPDPKISVSFQLINSFCSNFV